MPNNEEKVYYASLVIGLRGNYVKFTATDEFVVRRHCNEYFGKLWCSVYSEDYFKNTIKERFKVKVINEDDPIVLGANWAYE